MTSTMEMSLCSEHCEISTAYAASGISSNSAANFFSAQFGLDCNPPPLFLSDINAGATAYPFTKWQPAADIQRISSAPASVDGPFSAVPAPVVAPALISSSTPPNMLLHADDPHSHQDFSFMACLPKNLSFSDLLSFNAPQIPADLDMSFCPPTAAEDDIADLGSPRKLSAAPQSSSCIGADGALCSGQAPMVASAAGAEGLRGQSPIMQDCSYIVDDDGVKLSHLARSLTFPPGRPRLTASRSVPDYAARSPLLLADSDPAQRKHRRASRENGSCSMSTTTSHGSLGNSEGHTKLAQDVKVKIEGSEATQEVVHCQISQPEGPYQQTGGITIKGSSKQTKKRSAVDSTSTANVKIPRIETPPDVVHVRARRGQATDSHSLAERVRREKISQRMKVLQEIVPGCHKVLGKAMMLDEIINYVKSLQRQVEFLSMKLAVANQAGVMSAITHDIDFPSASSLGIFGDLGASQHPFMKLEPLITTMMQ